MAATDFDKDEEVFVEVAEDVLSKLSLFIGTKKYRGGFPNWNVFYYKCFVL